MKHKLFILYFTAIFSLSLFAMDEGSDEKNTYSKLSEFALFLSSANRTLYNNNDAGLAKYAKYRHIIEAIKRVKNLRNSVKNEPIISAHIDNLSVAVQKLGSDLQKLASQLDRINDENFELLQLIKNKANNLAIRLFDLKILRNEIAMDLTDN